MTCDKCGAPYTTEHKWNSGNPRDIDMPSCDCDTEATDAMLEAFFARLAKRREKHGS